MQLLPLSYIENKASNLQHIN